MTIAGDLPADNCLSLMQEGHLVMNCSHDECRLPNYHVTVIVLMDAASKHSP